VNPGRCCGCEGTENVRNIVALDARAPVPGTGWGCVVCGLQADGAVAVMCDECVAGKTPPRFACVGFPSKNERIPIDELRGTFGHDDAKHMAFDEHLARRRQGRPFPISVLIG
jgi:hypothetical protein